MKNKNSKIALCILVCIIAFFAGMRCYKAVYQKGFRAGVEFTLNEIKKLSEQESYGDGPIRGIQ